MSATLTRREEQVLGLVRRGLTNSEIAAELEIATRTVGKHLEHVYEKLETSTRTGALARWNPS
ncbi:MAG: helix-turn-helix transcriptional regulator [Actinobacteria bacterium]|nr:MAG: helix-turn-helix transcriptional regulator [Actinomycetota bacterium]